MYLHIIDTLKSNEFQDLISDISETTLDILLEEGTIKDIPIFGILFKGKNLISTIQDRLLSKKLMKFLQQLSNTTLEERNSLINKINTDKKYKVRIEEKILYIIDKCEDFEKAEIAGILFKNLLQQNISYEDFLRCINSINLLSNIDLKEFITTDAFIESFIGSNSSIYINSGLVEFKLKSNLRKINRAINTADIEVVYIPSNLGKNLRKILKKYYR